MKNRVNPPQLRSLFTELHGGARVPSSLSLLLSQSSFEVNTCTKVHKVYIRIFFINLY